jgi:aspartate carbamoyltransferase catalytic subunit
VKHLLSTEDLSLANAIRILDTAEEMAAVGDREVKKLPALRGRTVVNLFFEDSTRTRISFEAAAKRLSADVINFAAKGSSVSKGESLKDTAQTLSAMGADAVVIRHWASGAPHRLAATDWIDAAVINAGDGTHEHPTQALLDAFTMRRHWARLAGTASEGADLKGMRVAIAGDVLHSRVARSTSGSCAPSAPRSPWWRRPPCCPSASKSGPATVSYNMDETLEQGVDAVMMLRVQGERMNASFFPSTREYSRRWGFDDNRLRALDTLGMKDTIIMHPGPMNRGLEISAAAADSPRSTVLAQVRNGVSVRMAALYLLLSGDTREPAAPALAYAGTHSTKESN